MPVVSIRIPQLGEGLQEALLVDFLKEPGAPVKRDEPIYVMETDKATTDVESPYEGTLVEWTVERGTVLSIGTEIGRMEVAEGVREMPSGHGSADAPAHAPAASPAHAPPSAAAPRPAPTRRGEVAIPPKTRKYLKDKGLLDVADQIPAAGSKLMPEDVDRYLAETTAATAAVGESAEFTETPLPTSQISLNYRMSRGAGACIPVTIINEMDWTAIDAARGAARERGGPTGFAMACWCVVQAMRRHPKFHSALSADGRLLRTYRHINLGIAVARPNDELLTAVVPRAEEHDQPAFFAAFDRQVALAREGQDQADESTTLSVSNMGKADVLIGIPAIVAPAVATLVIGATSWRPRRSDDGATAFRREVAATLSFDHRVINGVGAAHFFNDLRDEIQRFQLHGL